MSSVMEQTKRPIKFRMWNFVKDDPSKSRMFYKTDEVMACLEQQTLFDSGEQKLGYDHRLDGNAFMQFTGLKDKNGKEIYEGDICKRPSSNGTADQMAIGYIVFYKSGFCFHRIETNLKFVIDNLVFHYADCEIIGNIYENPELLNQ